MLSPGQSLLLARMLLERFDPAALAESRLELPGTAASTGSREQLTILYGTHSGHCASIARWLASKAKAKGWACEVADMADYAKGQLKRETRLAVIVSTHGEGQPPESAAGFFAFVLGERAPKLTACNFAVLALGDRTYERFCQAGVDLDERLAALGARRLLERSEVGVDFQESAEVWVERVIEALTPLAVQRERVEAPHAVVQASTRIGRENPWKAELLDRVVLSGSGSTQHYVHLELSLAGARLGWEPGDSLGMRPQNDPELVGRIIEALGARCDEMVQVGGELQSLGAALTSCVEIGQVTPSSLRKYATLGASGLATIVADAEGTKTYLYGRDWLDVLLEHPVPLGAQAFVAMLPELSSRSYSIASSRLVHPDEVHLLVSRVSYQARGRRRLGVASGDLAERLELGGQVPIWLEPNPSFRLPEDAATPIVLIGAGTGIAPFRAFLQARIATGAPGKNWVIFGNRQFRTDFTYQTEWLKWREQGVLTRMDIAFSRDGKAKRYVTDELKSHGRELWAWLEQGARLYLCGDRAKLSSSIDQTLTEVIATHGNCSLERAAERVGELVASRRYQKDVY